MAGRCATARRSSPPARRSRARDFGGCRCQAFFLTGRADVTDPACALAPERSAILAARAEAERLHGAEGPAFVYRGPGA